MKSIKKTLLNNEEIIYSDKLHWIIFSTPAILFAVGIYFHHDPTLVSTFILSSIVFLIWAVVLATTSVYVITNKRIIIKTGLISRNTFELYLNKIEGVLVNQTILGRMLGYGSVVICGTGGTKEVFKNISRPFEFRKQTQMSIELLEEKKPKKIQSDV